LLSQKVGVGEYHLEHNAHRRALAPHLMLEGIIKEEDFPRAPASCFISHTHLSTVFTLVTGSARVNISFKISLPPASI
jgi:hypothetical protein